MKLSKRAKKILTSVLAVSTVSAILIPSISACIANTKADRNHQAVNSWENIVKKTEQSANLISLLQQKLKTATSSQKKAIADELATLLKTDKFVSKNINFTSNINFNNLKQYLQAHNNSTGFFNIPNLEINNAQELYHVNFQISNTNSEVLSQLPSFLRKVLIPINYAYNQQQLFLIPIQILNTYFQGTVLNQQDSILNTAVVHMSVAGLNIPCRLVSVSAKSQDVWQNSVLQYAGFNLNSTTATIDAYNQMYNVASTLTLLNKHANNNGLQPVNTHDTFTSEPFYFNKSATKIIDAQSFASTFNQPLNLNTITQIGYDYSVNYASFAMWFALQISTLSDFVTNTFYHFNPTTNTYEPNTTTYLKTHPLSHNLTVQFPINELNANSPVWNILNRWINNQYHDASNANITLNKGNYQWYVNWKVNPFTGQKDNWTWNPHVLNTARNIFTNQEILQNQAVFNTGTVSSFTGQGGGNFNGGLVSGGLKNVQQAQQSSDNTTWLNPTYNSVEGVNPNGDVNKDGYAPNNEGYCNGGMVLGLNNVNNVNSNYNLLTGSTIHQFMLWNGHVNYSPIGNTNGQMTLSGQWNSNNPYENYNPGVNYGFNLGTITTGVASVMHFLGGYNGSNVQTNYTANNFANSMMDNIAGKGVLNNTAWINNDNNAGWGNADIHQFVNDNLNSQFDSAIFNATGWKLSTNNKTTVAPLITQIAGLGATNGTATWTGDQTLLNQTWLTNTWNGFIQQFKTFMGNNRSSTIYARNLSESSVLFDTSVAPQSQLSSLLNNWQSTIMHGIFNNTSNPFAHMVGSLNNLVSVKYTWGLSFLQNSKDGINLSPTTYVGSTSANVSELYHGANDNADTINNDTLINDYLAQNQLGTNQWGQNLPMILNTLALNSNVNPISAMSTDNTKADTLINLQDAVQNPAILFNDGKNVDNDFEINNSSSQVFSTQDILNKVQTNNQDATANAKDEKITTTVDVTPSFVANEMGASNGISPAPIDSDEIAASYRTMFKDGAFSTINDFQTNLKTLWSNVYGALITALNELLAQKWTTNTPLTTVINAMSNSTAKINSTSYSNWVANMLNSAFNHQLPSTNIFSWYAILSGFNDAYNNVSAFANFLTNLYNSINPTITLQMQDNAGDVQYGLFSGLHAGNLTNEYLQQLQIAGLNYTNQSSIVGFLNTIANPTWIKTVEGINNSTKNKQAQNKTETLSSTQNLNNFLNAWKNVMMSALVLSTYHNDLVNNNYVKTTTVATNGALSSSAIGQYSANQQTLSAQYDTYQNYNVDNYQLQYFLTLSSLNNGNNITNYWGTSSNNLWNAINNESANAFNIKWSVDQVQLSHSFNFIPNVITFNSNDIMTLNNANNTNDELRFATNYSANMSFNLNTDNFASGGMSYFNDAINNNLIKQIPANQTKWFDDAYLINNGDETVANLNNASINVKNSEMNLQASFMLGNGAPLILNRSTGLLEYGEGVNSAWQINTTIKDHILQTQTYSALNSTSQLGSTAYINSSANNNSDVSSTANGLGSVSVANNDGSNIAWFNNTLSQNNTITGLITNNQGILQNFGANTPLNIQTINTALNNNPTINIDSNSLNISDLTYAKDVNVQLANNQTLTWINPHTASNSTTQIGISATNPYTNVINSSNNTTIKTQAVNNGTFTNNSTNQIANDLANNDWVAIKGLNGNEGSAVSSLNQLNLQYQTTNNLYSNYVNNNTNQFSLDTTKIFNTVLNNKEFYIKNVEIGQGTLGTVYLPVVYTLQAQDSVYSQLDNTLPLSYVYNNNSALYNQLNSVINPHIAGQNVQVLAVLSPVVQWNLNDIFNIQQPTTNNPNIQISLSSAANGVLNSSTPWSINNLASIFGASVLDNNMSAYAQTSLISQLINGNIFVNSIQLTSNNDTFIKSLPTGIQGLVQPKTTLFHKNLFTMTMNQPNSYVLNANAIGFKFMNNLVASPTPINNKITLADCINSTYSKQGVAFNTSAIWNGLIKDNPAFGFSLLNNDVNLSFTLGYSTGIAYNLSGVQSINHNDLKSTSWFIQSQIGNSFSGLGPQQQSTLQSSNNELSFDSSVENTTNGLHINPIDASSNDNTYQTYFNTFNAPLLNLYEPVLNSTWTGVWSPNKLLNNNAGSIFGIVNSTNTNPTIDSIFSAQYIPTQYNQNTVIASKLSADKNNTITIPLSSLITNNVSNNYVDQLENNTNLMNLVVSTIPNDVWNNNYQLTSNAVSNSPKSLVYQIGENNSIIPLRYLINGTKNTDLTDLSAFINSASVSNTEQMWNSEVSKLFSTQMTQTQPVSLSYTGLLTAIGEMIASTFTPAVRTAMANMNLGDAILYGISQNWLNTPSNTKNQLFNIIVSMVGQYPLLSSYLAQIVMNYAPSVMVQALNSSNLVFDDTSSTIAINQSYTDLIATILTNYIKESYNFESNINADLNENTTNNESANEVFTWLTNPFTALVQNFAYSQGLVATVNNNETQYQAELQSLVKNSNTAIKSFNNSAALDSLGNNSADSYYTINNKIAPLNSRNTYYNELTSTSNGIVAYNGTINEWNPLEAMYKNSSTLNFALPKNQYVFITPSINVANNYAYNWLNINPSVLVKKGASIQTWANTLFSNKDNNTLTSMTKNNNLDAELTKLYANNNILGFLRYTASPIPFLGLNSVSGLLNSNNYYVPQNPIFNLHLAKDKNNTYYLKINDALTTGSQVGSFNYLDSTTSNASYDLNGNEISAALTLSSNNINNHSLFDVQMLAKQILDDMYYKNYNNGEQLIVNPLFTSNIAVATISQIIPLTLIDFAQYQTYGWNSPTYNEVPNSAISKIQSFSPDNQQWSIFMENVMLKILLNYSAVANSSNPFLLSNSATNKIFTPINYVQPLSKQNDNDSSQLSPSTKAWNEEKGYTTYNNLYGYFAQPKQAIQDQNISSNFINAFGGWYETVAPFWTWLTNNSTNNNFTITSLNNNPTLIPYTQNKYQSLLQWATALNCYNIGVGYSQYPMYALPSVNSIQTITNRTIDPMSTNYAIPQQLIPNGDANQTLFNNVAFNFNGSTTPTWDAYNMKFPLKPLQSGPIENIAANTKSLYNNKTVLAQNIASLIANYYYTNQNDLLFNLNNNYGNNITVNTYQLNNNESLLNNNNPIVFDPANYSAFLKNSTCYQITAGNNHVNLVPNNSLDPSQAPFSINVLYTTNGNVAVYLYVNNPVNLQLANIKDIGTGGNRVDLSYSWFNNTFRQAISSFITLNSNVNYPDAGLVSQRSLPVLFGNWLSAYNNAHHNYNNLSFSGVFSFNKTFNPIGDSNVVVAQNIQNLLNKGDVLIQNFNKDALYQNISSFNANSFNDAHCVVGSSKNYVMVQFNKQSIAGQLIQLLLKNPNNTVLAQTIFGNLNGWSYNQQFSNANGNGTNLSPNEYGFAMIDNQACLVLNIANYLQTSTLPKAVNSTQHHHANLWGLFALLLIPVGIAALWIYKKKRQKQPAETQADSNTALDDGYNNANDWKK